MIKTRLINVTCYRMDVFYQCHAISAIDHTIHFNQKTTNLMKMQSFKRICCKLMKIQDPKLVQRLSRCSDFCQQLLLTNLNVYTVESQFLVQEIREFEKSGVLQCLTEGREQLLVRVIGRFDKMKVQEIGIPLYNNNVTHLQIMKTYQVGLFSGSTSVFFSFV